MCIRDSSRLLKRFDELPKIQGCIKRDGRNQVDLNTKSSIECLSKSFSGEKADIEIANIIVPTLSKYLSLYKKKYSIESAGKVELENHYAFKRFEDKDDGFKQWHCEQGKSCESRVLVWNFYLNDASSGTEFLNFPTSKAKEGRLVIWPAAWTHTHRSLSLIHI